MKSFIIKLLPIIFIFIITLTSSAQSNRYTKNPRQVAWFVSADYSQYNSDLGLAKNNDANFSASSHKNWNHRESYSAGFQLGKLYKDNIFFMAGLRFTEHKITQLSGYQIEDWYEGTIPMSDNINLGRKLIMQSIEIPLEIRKDFQYGRFTVSPSLGLNVGLNLVKRQESFYTIENDNQLTQEKLFDNKMRVHNLYNISTTSKLELAYGIFRGNKIKMGFYHNFHIKDEMKLPDEFKSNIHSYGLQLGIEVPLLYLCNW